MQPPSQPFFLPTYKPTALDPPEGRCAANTMGCILSWVEPTAAGAERGWGRTKCWLGLRKCNKRAFNKETKTNLCSMNRQKNPTPILPGDWYWSHPSTMTGAWALIRSKPRVHLHTQGQMLPHHVNDPGSAFWQKIRNRKTSERPETCVTTKQGGGFKHKGLSTSGSTLLCSLWITC